MKPSAHFGPGPSQMYFTVEDHLRHAFREGIPSLGHRTKHFESIFQQTTEGLRELLGAPNNFYIFFAASATEIWERSIQNLVERKSVHFVNGAFSKRYGEIAQSLGKDAIRCQVNPGLGFHEPINIPADAELIALTHNETSTGVTLPMDFINQFRTSHPQALVAVDAVSSIPYPSFDFSKIDSLFFSVQKGFGLPAGLGVWMVNERCLAKAEALQSKGQSIGTYHSLPTYLTNAKKNQTPETPNVLGIYLLGKIVEDFLRRGIANIRKETDYKAALLYQLLDQHPLMSALVKNPSDRSKTVVVAECGEKTNTISNFLEQHSIQPGDGYGEFKTSQLRFANFPAHSKEQVERLVDVLTELR